MKFSRKGRGPILLATTLLVGISATRAHGQGGNYYSQSLGTSFTIQQVTVPGYATVWAALLTSQPSGGSPLRDAALQQGDLITRLDGIPVTTYAELESHSDWTTVRYLRQGLLLPNDCQTSVFIKKNGGAGSSP